MARDLTVVDRHLQHCFESGVAGDAQSYREFLEQLQSLLGGYFRKRLPERIGDIEDLIQEAVLAVHHRRHTYSRGVPITAWIHAIARHKFCDLLRADAGRAALFAPWDEANELADDSNERWLVARDLHRLLGALPPGQREAIHAVKLLGLSVAEAASQLGRSESSVKVAVHRGLQTLGGAAAPSGDGLAPA